MRTWFITDCSTGIGRAIASQMGMAQAVGRNVLSAAGRPALADVASQSLSTCFHGPAVVLYRA